MVVVDAKIELAAEELAVWAVHGLAEVAGVVSGSAAGGVSESGAGVVSGEASSSIGSSSPVVAASVLSTRAIFTIATIVGALDIVYGGIFDISGEQVC